MPSEKFRPLSPRDQHILPLLTEFKTHPESELPLFTVSHTRARTSQSWGRRLIAIGSLCFLLAFVRSSCLPYHRPLEPEIARNPAYLITAEHGAVAAENKRCSDIGVDVLKDGGNAVDAAVSAALCVGVVNMFSSGIGGGGFMTVRVPPETPGGESEVFTIDFRETAPALASPKMYVDDPSAAAYGGLSVGVPGELRGFEEAHRRWSSLPWSRLVEPSARLAAEWAVDVELAKRIQTFSDLMLANKDWSDVFAPEGKLLEEGDIIRRTNYSRTLGIIAEEGPSALYKGPIADSIIRKVQETGGILTHEDLEGYTVKVERALQGTYHDKKVYTPHAPTSGPVLLHMLNLLEPYDLIGEGRTPLNVHRMVEAMKFGFAARTKIGDLAYSKNSTDRVAEISTKQFADLLRANLTDDRTHPPQYYKPEFDIITDHGTSHTSAVDKNGMAVALTTTVNLVFGSQVLDPETGIIMNDEMDDFSIPGVPNGFGLWPSPCEYSVPSSATETDEVLSDNYPEPGKRPLSSTAPTIIEHEDGSFYLAIGGSGGSRIFPAMFQTLLNLDWGMDASEAVEYGRVHSQLLPLTMDADNILPGDVLEGLRERGHDVVVLDINRVASVIQLVVSENGTIYAASDSRKNGIAAGY